MMRGVHNRNAHEPKGSLVEVPGHSGWRASTDGHIYTHDGLRVREHPKEAGENRLRVNCKQHRYHYVAKLIARSFLGPDAETNAVIHVNGNTADNRLPNLRLVRNAGVNANCTGKRLLSVHERSLLHQHIRDGKAQTDIAVQMGISTRCVRYHHNGSCHCPNAVQTGSVSQLALDQDYI